GTRGKDMRAAPRPFTRASPPDMFKAGAAHPLLPWAIAEMSKTPPHVVESGFDAILAFDARPWLKDLKVPTTILHGRHDTLLPLAGGEVLKKQIPKAKLEVFENSGHAPHLEEPDQFNAALARVLA